MQMEGGVEVEGRQGGGEIKRTQLDARTQLPGGPVPPLTALLRGGRASGSTVSHKGEKLQLRVSPEIVPHPGAWRAV